MTGPTSSVPQSGLLRRFFAESVRPYLWLQVEIGLCIFVGVVLSLLDPILLKIIIDRALGDGDAALLLTTVLALLFLLVFRVAFRLVSVWLYSYSGLKILFELRQRVYEHTQALSIFYFRGERRGDILARLTSDIDVLQRAAAHTAVNAIQDLLTIFGIVSLLFWLDSSLALSLFFIYPFLVLGLLRINRRMRREGMNARKAIGELYTFLEERISGLRLIQEYFRQKAEARRHVQVSRPWIRSNLNLSVLGALQVSLADLMSTGAFVLVFLWGGYRVLQGELSLGSLVAFYTLASRLYPPISGLIDINIDLQLARASLQRIYSLLDEEPSVPRPVPGLRPSRVLGRIEARQAGVCFEDGTVALESIDLKVEPGEIVALVGPSGSGKSTLSALLARYLDPARGGVYLDGHDLRSLDLRWLRKTIGLVAQETQLFHETLRDNLLLAKPRASDAELQSVLEKVELGSFLTTLSRGLDTLVGEEGLRLSGGERQRIALARILLKDPKVLLLDEATSALDFATEERVLGVFLDLVPEKTLVLVTHHLSTKVHPDRLLEMKDGRLVESSTSEGVLSAASRSHPLRSNGSDS